MPFAARVQPVSVFTPLPEYVIDSVSMTTVPDASKLALEVSVMVVADELMPPFKVLLAVPATTPPQVPAPQPADTV